MGDLNARIEELLKRLSSAGPEASVELMLEQMEPEKALLLRLCAIPHQFNIPILQVLKPRLAAAQASQFYLDFALLPIVVSAPEGLALQDSARHYLFSQWLVQPARPQFKEISRNLFRHFEELLTEEQVKDKESLEFRRMFHQLGFQQAEGFAEFERLFREERRELSHNKCELLLKLVHEYDAVLSSSYKDWLIYHEGKLKVDLRELPQAAEIFGRLLNKVGIEKKLQIKACVRLGMVYSKMGEWERAEKYYEQALDLVGKGEGEEELVGRILHGRGVALGELGKPVDAERSLKESIMLAEQEQNTSMQAISLNSLGTLYRKSEEYDKAIEAYEHSLALLNQIGDKLRVSEVYTNLALVYARQNDWARSMRLYNLSLDIKQKAGDIIGEAKTLNNLARVYKNIGNYDQAVASARMAVSKFESVHDFNEMAKAQWTLGQLCNQIGRRKDAFSAYQGALKIFEQEGRFREADNIRTEMNTYFKL